jgi:L-ascorbate metabolism protein UlaG (beta-lactamase superfamily)
MRNEDPVYLKPNIVLEPLVDRWYAWPHLVSPATAAMNIKGRHLKIMNSYIQAPQIHAAAVSNPRMKGGPFMDFKAPRVREVEQLRNKTQHERKDQLDLAQALKELAALLREQATGFSMEPLYPLVPDILRGYVELVYDLSHRPAYRLFESLLYRSRFYNPGMQSIALWLTDNDERPFVLSTPRLDEDEVLHLDIPFSHPVIDLLSRMKAEPLPYGQVRQQLSLSDAQEQLFRSFFTAEPPVAYRRYDGDQARMRYLGHACILIETRELSILVDPLVSYYGYQSDVSRFSYQDLPDVIDYVLVTHNHQDHILFETLLQIRHKVKHIIIPRSSTTLQDPNLKLMFEHIGFTNVIEIDEMESLHFGDCTLTGIPFIGEHSDLDIRTKICHHLQINDFSILFAADSCNVEPRLYQHIHGVIGDVDVVFLGMECDGAPLTWLYGPLLSEDLARDKDGSRRLAGSNFEKGKHIVDTFNPGEVYVYAMGQEPWLEYISSIKYTEESNPIVASNRLVQYCESRGITAERLFGEKELHCKVHEECLH